MKPYEVIQRLVVTNSKNEKEEIIREAWEAGCTEFFKGARLAYDAMVTFGVKQVPTHNGEQFFKCMDWILFNELAEMLQTRQLTGHAARDAIISFMESCSQDQWDGFYRLVLLKDLKCGVSEKTINKVLKSIGGEAMDYITPVFTCQLAHSGEKHPKKLRGHKLLDVKLDGVRILAVLNKELGTVTLHTRNGNINENFPQIESLLATLIPHIPESIVLDGEMVSQSFNELMTQFQRKKADTSDAKFALFDMIPLKQFLNGKSEFDQVFRRGALETLCVVINDERVYAIPYVRVDLDTEEGQAGFKAYNRLAIDNGFEGIMIKDPTALYVCKRSHAWLKIKPTITVDLQIVGTEAGEADTKYEHCLGKILCEGTDEASGKDIVVSVGSGLSDEQREEFWNNRDALVGRTVEILADVISKNQDGTYSLRFPRFVRFRDDKEAVI